MGVRVSAFTRRRRSRGLVGAAAVAIVLSLLVPASPAVANRSRPSTDHVATRHSHFHGRVPVRFTWLEGYDDPATPNRLDRVGVLKIGHKRARNILILNPGTSAGSAYFAPLAKDIVRATHGRWQVWSVERRENQLEDHSVLNGLKRGTVTPRQSFDYYLNWLTNPAITHHIQLIPDTDVAFARVGLACRDRGPAPRREGGTRARPARRHGRPLARRIDHHRVRHVGLPREGRRQGSCRPGLHRRRERPDADHARRRRRPPCKASRRARPGSPSAGSRRRSSGSTRPVARRWRSSTRTDGPSVRNSHCSPPTSRRRSRRRTRRSSATRSTPTRHPRTCSRRKCMRATLPTSGDPRGWTRAGDITPIQRYARMLSGTGLIGIDGSAWYHPTRLTIDAGAVAAGNANPGARCARCARHPRRRPEEAHEDLRVRCGTGWRGCLGRCSRARGAVGNTLHGT